MQHELENAVRLHQTGRLPEALAIYESVLVRAPRHPDALHLAGMIDLAQGRTDRALERMDAAINASGPNAPPHFFFNRANALRAAGRWNEAEAGYRRAIDTGGNTPDVLNNLGITLMHLQRFEEAAAVLTDCVRARPHHPGSLCNLASALCKVGAARKALELADAAFSLDPALAPALVCRIQSLRLLGRTEEACAASESLIHRTPHDPAAWVEHGFSHAAAGHHDHAITAFSRAAALAPQSAEAHANLGALHLQIGALDHADLSLRRALDLTPHDPACWRHLATLRVRQQRFDEAPAAARRALELAPGDALNHAALASVHLIRDELPEAEKCYRRALEFDSALASAWNGLGVAREKQGDDTEALSCYDRAIELQPQDAHAHLNRAIVLLLQGQMPEGWREYEWRIPWSKLQGGKVPSQAPPWKLGDRLLDGSLPRILLYTEQGLGDAVQFLRFAPLIKPHAARLILATNNIVAPLAAMDPSLDEIAPINGPLPAHDRAISLMSLPAALGTTIASIPSTVPYVHVPPEKREPWSLLVPREQGTLNVALAWSGSPLNQHSRNRTIPLEKLRPFASVPNTRFFAVLKGPETQQIPSVLPWHVTDLSPYLNDLGDTAAALERMDLVISVDTSVAHLAGALARPVWLMTFFPPDFRWLKDRSDSPWYPTMRIYRQQQRWVWDPIIEQVARDLADFASRSRSRNAPQ